MRGKLYSFLVVVVLGTGCVMVPVGGPSVSSVTVPQVYYEPSVVYPYYYGYYGGYYHPYYYGHYYYGGGHYYGGYHGEHRGR